MHEQLFLYFRILKTSKSKTRKSSKSRKCRKNYSEFSYSRVFNFALQPKSKTWIWNSWKKFPRFPRFPRFPSFRPNLKFTQFCNFYRALGNEDDFLINIFLIKKTCILTFNEHLLHNQR